MTGEAKIFLGYPKDALPDVDGDALVLRTNGHAFTKKGGRWRHTMKPIVISGTTNRITVIDNGNGGITISAPQDLHTGASPTFQAMKLNGLTASVFLMTDGSKNLVSHDLLGTAHTWAAANTFNGMTYMMNNAGVGTTSPQRQFVISNAGAQGWEFRGSDGGTGVDVIAFNRSTSSYVAMALTASSYAFNTGAATFGSTVKATQFFLSALNTAPATAGATGTAGEIRFTSSGIYICTATNTWIKAAAVTF